MRQAVRNRQHVEMLCFSCALILWRGIAGTALHAGESGRDNAFVYGELFRPVAFCSLAATSNMCEIRASALLYPSLLRRKTPRKAEFEGWLTSGPLEGGLPGVGEGGRQQRVFDLHARPVWVNSQGQPVGGDDGEFCAADVVRTVEAMKNRWTQPKSPFDVQIGHARQNEKDRVTIILKFLRQVEDEDPYNLFTFPILPCRLANFDRIDRKEDEVVGPRYFLGPYLLQSGGDKTKNKIVFKANPEYFEGKPKIEKIILQQNDDLAVLHDLVRAGMIHALPEVKPSNIDDLQRRPEMTLENYNSYSYYFLGFNLDKKVFVEKKSRDNIFKTRKLREAVTLCLRRQDIINYVYHKGNARLLSGPFPPNSIGDIGFSAVRAGKEYQMQREEERREAEEFLAKFKAEHAAEKVFLAHKLVGNQDDIFSVCRAIQEQLQEMLGSQVVRLPLNESEWEEEMFQKGGKERGFHLALERFSMGWDLDISPLFESDGACNFMHFSDAYVDAMLSMARVARYDDWADICRILQYVIRKSYPAVFCWQVKSYAAYNSEEFDCTIDPFSFFFKVHEWKPR